MFVAVIPALKLPRQMTEPFDYAVPADLRSFVGVGSVVLVPWRGRSVPGVVRAVLAEPSIDAKRVKPIDGLAPCAPLSAGLLETYDWMASQYFCAPGTVVQCFLPTVPKRALKKFEPSGYAAPARAARHPGDDARSEVVRYGSATAKMDAVAELVRDAFKKGHGVIVIAPHQQDVALTAARLRTELGDDAVTEFHGELAATPLWNTWTRGASPEKPTVVVGTRMAVGVPVARLGTIVVLESDSPDHKQYDQNPRYDARAAALRRAAEERAAVVFLSHAPRAEEFALVEGRDFAWREVGTAKASVSLAETARHVRSAEERLLSPAAHQAIETALQSQKKVLLFHNRRGTATALICRDCGRPERCPTCLVPARVHKDALQCHRCGVKRPLPMQCGGCGSASLKTAGLGTGALTPLLAAAYPEAKIAQLDSDDRLADISTADIVIGTQLLVHAAAELPDAPRFGAVVATSVDGLLGHPGYRTTENAWRTVRTLADVATAGEGTLVLQTIDNESPEVRELLEDAQTFLARELALRQKAGYPPVAALVAVTAVAATEAAAMAAARKTVAALKPVAGAKVLVTGPLRPANPFRNGTWRSLLVVKAPRLSPELEAALRALPEEYIIDRDPEYLG